MALTYDLQRRYGASSALKNHSERAQPVAASTLIYEGAAVGITTGDVARGIGATSDIFAGFAVKRADNSAGAAGDKRVDLVEEGHVELNVTGVSSTTNIGVPIYATDDNTFDLTSSTATLVGRLSAYIGADGYANHGVTTCLVYFQAASRRNT
jgi:hypothetical protein